MVENVTEPNFIGTLGINWKLFLAQLVNFSIVLFILWRWVFKPVAGALESRRQRVEKSVKTAEEIERRLAALEVTEAEKLKIARIEAERILKEAAALSAEAASQSRTAAKAEAEKILAEAKAAIESEKEKILAEARTFLSELAIMTSEKVLRQKLDSKADKEFVEQVLKNVK